MKAATKARLRLIAEVDSRDIRAELYGLLCKLSPTEVAAYHNRITNGEVEGDWYIDTESGCGCIYGTAAALALGAPTEPVKERSLGLRVDHWISAHFPTKTMHSTGETTPLERLAFHIHQGDTPDNNEFSAWLATEVAKYMEAL